MLPRQYSAMPIDRVKIASIVDASRKFVRMKDEIVHDMTAILKRQQ